MYTALTTPNQSSLGLIPVPSKNVCHGLLQYVLFSDENGVCMTRKTIHHFHCLFSQNENRTKLSVHLKTTSRQPVNQIGWNLTNWLPDSYSKNNRANFDFFFSFLSNSIFSTGNSNDLLSLTSSTQLSQKNKRTRQKSESRLSSQTCHEANAILIDFFRLFLADLDLNLQKHVSLAKSSSILKRVSVLDCLKKLAVIFSH